MDKFKNRYRIATARAQWWNYGWNGAYFITICTKNRLHFFGEINNGTMVLSNLGVIANVLWHQIPNHNPVVELGDFVVMPNHIHGILKLNKPEIGGLNVNENVDGNVDGDVDVETLHATSLQLQQSLQLPRSPKLPQLTELPQSPNQKNQTMANISPKSNTVSAIVRSYKSAVTNHANRLGFENGWQSRFHDHIIRNHDEYKRISDYIADNPANWCNDTFFTE